MGAVTLPVLVSESAYGAATLGATKNSNEGDPVARIDVIMPQMGESIAEGTMSRWLKKVGDAVKRDEPIFEISTDKVDAEIPSPTAGVLAEVLVTEGQTVPVQTIVARIETEAVQRPSPAPAAAAPAPAAPPRQPRRAPAESRSTAPACIPHQTPARRSRRIAAAPARQRQRRIDGGATPHEVVAARSEDRRGARHRDRGPAGSGIAGRVTKRDIMQVIESGAPQRRRRAVLAPSMHAPAGVEQHGPLPEPWAGDVVEPMSRIRALTAEHMSLSRRTTRTSRRSSRSTSRAWRAFARSIRGDFEKQTGEKLTYLPFISRRSTTPQAVPDAQRRRRRQRHHLPQADTTSASRWRSTGGSSCRSSSMPTSCRSSGLTRQLNDLATRARAKKLSPERSPERDVHHHQPRRLRFAHGHADHHQSDQSAILGVGAIEKRPKVMTGRTAKTRSPSAPARIFSLSFDHRVDRRCGRGPFLATVKKTLEIVSRNRGPDRCRGRSRSSDRRSSAARARRVFRRPE